MYSKLFSRRLFVFFRAQWLAAVAWLPDSCGNRSGYRSDPVYEVHLQCGGDENLWCRSNGSVLCRVCICVFSLVRPSLPATLPAGGSHFFGWFIFGSLPLQTSNTHGRTLRMKRSHPQGQKLAVVSRSLVALTHNNQTLSGDAYPHRRRETQATLFAAIRTGSTTV